MKRVPIRILSALLVAVMLMSLVSCSGLIDTGNWEPKDKSATVLLYCNGAVEVADGTTRTVKNGEAVEYKLTFGQGCVFRSLEVTVGDGVAEFDEATATVTVSGATRNTVVNLFTADVEYSTDEEVKYVFRGSKGDVSKPGSSAAILAGTLISLTAGDNERVFRGWSLGASLAAGGTLLSESRSYQFRLSPDMEKNGVVTVFSNYVDANKLIYDLNGGSLDASATNAKGNNYYTAALSGNRLTVTYTKEYLEFMECGSSFWDDGSFKRDGYILKEYNTKADGTGVGYSLGSKVPLVGEAGSTVLYCIWSEQTPTSDFTYEPISIPYAYGANAAKAPHWSVEGIKITSYLGNAETVTVPESIDGKFVTAIGAGAFENKAMTTLVMGGRVLKIEDGAFVNCSSLKTFHCPDTLVEATNGAMDAATTASLENFYLNAAMAPRYSGASDAGLAVKLSRLLASYDKNRVIVVAGSSAYQGLASRYLEDLLDGDYRVVNFGTTRTTNGGMYLEAMQSLAHEGDVIIYAPENSSYMMGERELYWKTMRDLEHMYNIYREVDISNYTNVLGALTSFNTDSVRGRYKRNPTTYEGIVAQSSMINKYGDYQKADRQSYLVEDKYIDTYYITLNHRIKSRFDLDWNSADQSSHADYNDPTDNTWCSFTDPYYKDEMNRAVLAAKGSGAKVYFGFCPVDGSRLVAAAQSESWILAYDQLIKDTYVFDGIVGSALDYVYDHKYFYDCAFHLNDYGRTVRTYQVYLDLCPLVGKQINKCITDLGTAYEGCLFEVGAQSGPVTPWIPTMP